MFIQGSVFFFCIFSDDKDQKKSQKVLAELENIDDECDQNDIAFVKIDDDKEAQEWGIDEIPTIVSIFLLSFFCDEGKTNFINVPILIGFLRARNSTCIRR